MYRILLVFIAFAATESSVRSFSFSVLFFLFDCFVLFLLLLLSLTGTYLRNLIRRWYYCDEYVLSSEFIAST